MEPIELRVRRDKEEKSLSLDVTRHGVRSDLTSLGSKIMFCFVLCWYSSGRAERERVGGVHEEETEGNPGKATAWP